MIGCRLLTRFDVPSVGASGTMALARLLGHHRALARDDSDPARQA